MALSLMKFQEILLNWYRNGRRDLPWRTTGPNSLRPDPYHVLVSEAMLQQTQVATVTPYFLRFVAQLPTLSDLAAAPEQQVLRLWQGLGYYSRARNLRLAAQAIVREHAGIIPRTVEELMRLPGIGPYTAGAIASLAYDQPAAILDGNVTRVICRIDGITDNPKQAAVRKRLWARASELVPDEAAGDFNSAMMELGATVCTPRKPLCRLCPVRKFCAAEKAGAQELIPPRATALPRPIERRWTIVIERAGKFLIEQRPQTGRWAGMWQFITLIANGELSPKTVCAATGLQVSSLRQVGTIKHELTHRRYEFEIYRCRANGRQQKIRLTSQWVSLADLGQYPLSRPQLRIAEMIRSESG